MRRALRYAGWTLLALLFVAGVLAWKTLFGHPFRINHLANRQAAYFLLRNPELFSQVGAVDGTILDRHSGRLADVGRAKRDADYEFAEHALVELHEFDRARLDAQDRITYDILEDFYGSSLAFRRFDWLSSEGLYPISPMFGTQVQLATFLQNTHVVKNEKTARNYVKRLRATGPKLDALTAEMQLQAKQGVVLPISLLERSIAVITDTIAPQPAASPFVTTFTTRMEKVQGLDPALRAQLAKEAAEIVETGIYPAYRRMIAALDALRPQAATQAAGVGRLPDGAAYYAAMLREMTTSDDPPERIHAIGLAEVARIDAEMDDLLRGQGYLDGTVAQRVKALSEDPKFLYPNTDDGRKQMLGRYREILAEVQQRMPEFFRTVPAVDLAVERMPVAAEKGSGGAYYSPAAMDGSRPGTFYASLRDTAETPMWSMKTLAYHEGIPGHHFQIATAQGLKGLPLIRQQPIYTAYAEGWALYAERLAAEIGMYRDDPLGDLGRLQAEMYRAVRLVVDTGLHAKGWTREQAIAYMVDHTGMSESDVTSEIERYMALPGQACAYKVGQLKILALRESAKAALGPRFDLKEFHAVILENGAVPLTILERLVDEWIAKKKAQPQG